MADSTKEQPLAYFIDLIEFKGLDKRIHAFFFPTVPTSEPPDPQDPEIVDYHFLEEDLICVVKITQFDLDSSGFVTRTSRRRFVTRFDEAYSACIRNIDEYLIGCTAEKARPYLLGLLSRSEYLSKELEAYQLRQPLPNAYQENPERLERCFQVVRNTMRKVTDRLAEHYLPQYPAASTAVALPLPTPQEPSRPVMESPPRIVWKKDPHLFFLLMTALYEEGFIENTEGKKALKPIADTLYNTFLIPQKQGNREPITPQSFYQHLKPTGLLQDGELNKDIKAMIIRMLNEIQEQ